MSKIDYEQLEKDRSSLGKKPKCPDCNNVLGDSFLIPYYLVCNICSIYWNPNLKTKMTMEGVPIK